MGARAPPKPEVKLKNLVIKIERIRMNDYEIENEDTIEKKQIDDKYVKEKQEEVVVDDEYVKEKHEEVVVDDEYVKEKSDEI